MCKIYFLIQNQCCHVKLFVINKLFFDKIIYNQIKYKQKNKISLNLSPPGQNGFHFADDNLKYIFVNEKFHMLIEISLKFVP